MYCPHCEKINKCFCSNCNKNHETEGVVLIDKKSQMYRCYYCLELFHEQDSMDYEWDKMIERFGKEIPPDICLKWWESSRKIGLKNGNKQKELEKKYGRFGIEHAFKIHFNLNPKDINWEIFYKLKRENTINKLL